MTDLDTLRPEVRDALMHIRPSAHRFEINSWNCVRAELLRLAGLEKQLRDAYARQHEALQGWVQRATDDEVELAALKARIGASRLIEPGVQFPVPGYVGKRVRLVVEE